MQQAVPEPKYLGYVETEVSESFHKSFLCDRDMIYLTPSAGFRNSVVSSPLPAQAPFCSYYPYKAAIASDVFGKVSG